MDICTYDVSSLDQQLMHHHEQSIVAVKRYALKNIGFHQLVGVRRVSGTTRVQSSDSVEGKAQKAAGSY